LQHALESEGEKREAIRALKEQAKAATESAEKQAINKRVQEEVTALMALASNTAAVREQCASSPHVCLPAALLSTSPPTLRKLPG